MPLMRVPFSSSCVFLALALVPSVARETQADLAALRRGLKSEQREQREAAYRTIAGLVREERSDGVRLLEAERRSWTSSLQRAVRRTDGLLGSADRFGAARLELVARWEAAAREALAAIFDEQLFPTPDGPIFGPHEGYEAVVARVRTTLELHEDLRRLADKDLRKALRLERGEAAELLGELGRAQARVDELGTALAALGEESEPPTSATALGLALLRLAAGDWAALHGLDVRAPPADGDPAPACQVDWFPEHPGGPGARGWDAETQRVAASGPRLEGYERFLFHHALGELVEARNASVELEVSATGREAVAAINRYRSALGVRPLQLHPALGRALRDHLWTLRELSHEGQTPETRTAAQRIVVAGYPASHATGENLSTADIVAAVEQWKWDGGHHRILVHPCVVHIGAFQGAFSGMLVAAGDAPELPSPVLLAFDL